MNKDIKKAILNNRGGLDNATDSQLMLIWSSLPLDIQTQYMQTVKKGKEDASVIREKSGI